MMTSLKTGLLIFILVFISFPLVQKEFSLFDETELKGFFQQRAVSDYPVLTRENWLNAVYQPETEEKINDNVGCRTTFIRLYNELDFRLFRLSHAEGFIVGKEDCLFEEDYIFEYTGRYFIGEKTLDRKLRKLGKLNDALRDLNMFLLLVLEPGKASFCPEFIPDRYFRRGMTLSNATYILRRAEEMNLPVLDLNACFLALKDRSPYPLFTKYGMHWSIYGASIAVDTLNQVLSCMSNTYIPSFQTEGYTLTNQLRSTDNDIEKTFNLMCELPEIEAAYPEIVFGDDTVRRNLKMLVVGDSYYNNIKEDYSPYTYLKDDFWYYNRKHYPYIHVQHHDVDHENLAEKIRDYQGIMVMSSEINLHCFFWNFIDQLYTALFPGDHEPWIYYFEDQIRNDRKWFRYVVRNAIKNQSSLEHQITREARYVFYRDFHQLKNRSHEDSVLFMMQAIRYNPEWLQAVKQKAMERAISLEEMIRIDAEFMCNLN